jgi:hypothetical protein
MCRPNSAASTRASWQRGRFCRAKCGESKQCSLGDASPWDLALPSAYLCRCWQRGELWLSMASSGWFRSRSRNSAFLLFSGRPCVLIGLSASTTASSTKSDSPPTLAPPRPPLRRQDAVRTPSGHRATHRRQADNLTELATSFYRVTHAPMAVTHTPTGPWPSRQVPLAPYLGRIMLPGAAVDSPWSLSAVVDKRASAPQILSRASAEWFYISVFVQLSQRGK